MAKKSNRKETHISTQAKISGKTSRTGREVWSMQSDGKKRTFITSKSSARVMDEAVTIYNGALERLAKR